MPQQIIAAQGENLAEIVRGCKEYAVQSVLLQGNQSSIRGNIKLDALLPGEFFSIHGGYSTNDVNADPEVLVPLSTIKELEKEGKFGSLYPYLFTTTGNLTALKEARRMGEEIAQEVRNRDVDAVIFVST